MIKQKHKGARNELAAICWLLDQGYDVFRNVSPHGIIDVIAVRDDETIFIDVKSTFALASAEQAAADVKFLVSLGDGRFELYTPTPQLSNDPTNCGMCGRLINYRGNGTRKYCSSKCSYENARQKLLEKKTAAPSMILAR